MDEEEYVAPPQSSPTDDGFVSSLRDAALDFDNNLEATLRPEDYKKLRTIGAFLLRGLTLEESCILAKSSIEKLKVLMSEHDVIRNFIVFKQLSFKASLLDTMTQSAIKKGEVKSAGYLLEKKYPREFDKQKDDDVRDPDVVEKAIKFVQGQGDTTPIVKRLPERTS